MLTVYLDAPELGKHLCFLPPLWLRRYRTHFVRWIGIICSKIKDTWESIFTVRKEQEEVSNTKGQIAEMNLGELL